MKMIGNLLNLCFSVVVRYTSLSPRGNRWNVGVDSSLLLQQHHPQHLSYCGVQDTHTPLPSQGSNLLRCRHEGTVVAFHAIHRLPSSVARGRSVTRLVYQPRSRWPLAAHSSAGDREVGTVQRTSRILSPRCGCWGRSGRWAVSPHRMTENVCGICSVRKVCWGETACLLKHRKQ